MSQGANVIAFPPDRQPQLLKQYQQLPQSVKDLHDSTKKRFSTAFVEMFDKADNVFYQLADRSESNREQTQHFDAMRETRLRRKSIFKAFQQNWQNQFALLLNDTGVQENRLEANSVVDLESLSLMNEEEMEEKVALESMVSKVKGELTVPLIHLSMRIGSLVRGSQLDQEENPFSPQQFCAAFIDACESLTIEIKAKIHLYKLFEQEVVSLLPQLVSEANRHLIASGILPDLANSTKASQVSTNLAKEKAVEAQPQREELFQLLRDVFNQNSTVESNGNVSPNLGSSVPSTSASSGTSAPVYVGQNELVDMLSCVQANTATSEHEQVDVMSSLQSMLVQRAGKGNVVPVFGPADRDVISLVAMLFEFILHDENLPPAMGNHLGRLQIPFIKLGLEDVEFFNSSSHPARKLLNTLASAAIGWSGENDRAGKQLFEKVSSVVAKVVDEYQSGRGLFEELLEDFSAFLEKEKRRVELIEQRTKAAEEGRGKSERAQAQVDALIDSLLKDSQPDLIRTFVQDTWSRVLFLRCVRDGENSDSYNEAALALKELVWSIAPKTRAEQKELMSLMPGLLQKLSEGMQVAGLNPESASQFLAQLETLHLEAMKSISEPVEKPAEQATYSESTSCAGDNELVSSDIEGGYVEKKAGISDLDPQAVTQTVKPAEAAIDEQYLKLVAKLTMGTWCELQDEQNGKIRCKLVAIIKSTGSYIFVNRSGMKVAEKNKEQLAADMRDDRVVILDDSQLFDRALESVISNLRKVKAS